MNKPLKIINNINALNDAHRSAREQKKRIGFVATMGNLHAGHLALVKKAQKLTDIVLVSIFVNPLQFAPGEDLDSYPRTLAEDMKKLRDIGADIVFTPSDKLLYPSGIHNHTQVTAPTFQGKCCAVSRPHFFIGVATVVMKLLNLIKPDVACFGEKDFQQLAVIKQMVKDLFIPIEIIAVPTVREADGLAMSSRNQYLTPKERNTAPALYAALANCARQIQNGARDYAQCSTRTRQALTDAGFKVDYLEICTQTTLAPPQPQDKAIVICAAVFLGKARLIDNIQLCLNNPDQPQHDNPGSAPA